MNTAFDRMREIDPKSSPIMNAIELLTQPSPDPAINRNMTDEAALLLSELISGATKLTHEVMEKRSHTINELVRHGCIRLDLKNRDNDTGITPGKIISSRVIVMADEMLYRIEKWKARQ